MKICVLYQTLTTLQLNGKVGNVKKRKTVAVKPQLNIEWSGSNCGQLRTAVNHLYLFTFLVIVYALKETCLFSQLFAWTHNTNAPNLRLCPKPCHYYACLCQLNVFVQEQSIQKVHHNCMSHFMFAPPLWPHSGVEHICSVLTFSCIYTPKQIPSHISKV